MSTIPISGYPSNLAVNASGTRVYVASGDVISIIDTSTNSVVRTLPADFPVDVRFGPDGSRAYVTNIGDGTLRVVDTTNNTLAAIVPIGSDAARLAVSPDGSRVYVTDRDAGRLVVVDAATNTVSAVIPIGSSATDVVLSPDGARAFVTNFADGTLTVVDTSDNTVVTTIPVAPARSVDQVLLSPDGSRAYVHRTGSSPVYVIDTTTNTVVATIPVTAFELEINQDGTLAYAPNWRDDGAVSVISLDGGARVPSDRTMT
ncbi:MAG: YncE family protein [Williamsia herbipolensis]|nr:YncE family protein [Williamsia herbipolensis]